MVVKLGVLEICSKLGCNKAPVFDGISNKTLKLAGKSRPVKSLGLFEACLLDGIFPEI